MLLPALLTAKIDQTQSDIKQPNEPIVKSSFSQRSSPRFPTHDTHWLLSNQAPIDNLASLFLSSPATTINVNSTLQSPGVTGDCTLGEAIQAANTDLPVDGCVAGSGVGADTIFLPAGTYTLTSVAYSDPLRGAVGLPPILSDIIFQGAGRDTTIVERDLSAPQFRLMNTGGDIGDLSGSITLNDLTMRGGREEYGGALAARGAWQFTLNRVLFVDNRATRLGGAVGNNFDAGSVVATDCTFTNNAADQNGGAIHVSKITLARGTFRNNSAGAGGAIYYSSGSGGNFDITDCVFIDNKANTGSSAIGGGAITLGGTGTIIRSQFIHNIANSAGGAIQAGGPSLNLIDSVVTDSQADSGGGLFIENCALNLTRTTIANNQATGHDGGGIFVNSGQIPRSITIANSTISGNAAHFDGGGLNTVSSNVIVTNSTIDGNTSGRYGGGISAYAFQPGSLFLNNVTITANQAAGQGGGILVFHTNVSSTLANTIVALNTSASAPDLYAQGSFTSVGYNLIGIADGSNLISATGDQTGTAATPINPRLGPLQNNGGTTFTRALLANSSALDQANPAEPGSGGGACMASDQRGVLRPQDGDNNGSSGCDIGAYEQLHAVSCTTPPDGMTGWWAFDGNTNEIQGGNNVVLFGNQGFTTGKVDQGLAFDGLDDYAVASADAVLDVGASEGLTFDLWFNPTEIQTARPLIEWESGLGPHLWMSADFAEGGRGVGSLFVNLPDSVGTYHIFSSPPGLLTANTWQHVAVTYDKPSGVAKIFLNGATVAEQNLGSFRPQTTADLFFGYRPFGVLAGRHFRGSMDEVEVFNRALDPAEIHAIYFADYAGKCKPAPSPTPTPTPRSCLEAHVSWYRGENDALDSSGNNNGTPRNGATFATGKVGQGFLLDGVDDYIECPDNPSLDPGVFSFTIDAWIKSSLTTGYQPIITKYECGGVCPTTARSYYALYIFDGRLQGGLRDTNGNEQILTGTNIVADGFFHHIAMVRDVGAGELRIYVDGTVAASAALTVTNAIQNDDSEADPLTIGFQRPPQLNPGAALYFNGLIDEVDYFNRALTKTDIAAIFNAGSVGKCSSIPSAVIDITENVSVSDQSSPSPSATSAIAEHINVLDQTLLLPTLMIAVDEHLHVTDNPVLIKSAVLSIDEQIKVIDVADLRPAAMLAINENVSVLDSVRIVPPALISIDEQIKFIDTPASNPGASLSISENISVWDTERVLPAAVISIDEQIKISDTSLLSPEPTPTPSPSPSPSPTPTVSPTPTPVVISGIAVGPIYTSGASYRVDSPVQTGQVFDRGASYRVQNPEVPVGPVFTSGTSYSVKQPETFGPVFTVGSSYAVVTAPQLAPVFTPGASYQIQQPVSTASIFTAGVSYRIDQQAIQPSPVFTSGASYRIAPDLIYAANDPANTRLTARVLQQNVLDELTVLRRAAADQRSANAFDEVVEHLRRSLVSELWLDEDHLEPELGQVVFIENAMVISKLQRLMKLTAASPEIIERLIDRIATSDRELALTAVGEAFGIGGNEQDDFLTVALTDIRSGDGPVMSSHYRGEVQYYHNAWRAAVAAVQKRR